MEFEIPQHPEDLESQRAGKLYVRAVLDVENCANIDAVIDEVAAAVLDSKNIFETVTSPGVFDKLYSLIKFWSCHGASIKQRVIDLLISTVQEVLSAIVEARNETSTPSDATKLMVLRRAAFKATAYLYAIGVQVADKTSVPAGADAMGAGKKGKGKGKSKKTTADADDDDEADAEAGNDGEGAEGSWDWSSLREACVRLLCDVLCADMRKLWPLGVPEEEMIVVIVKSAARMLTNAVAMKDKDVRRAVVELIGTACRRFPSVAATAVVTIADAVSKHEHAVAVAVDLAELMSCGLTPQGGLPSSVLGAGNGEKEEGSGPSATVEGLPYGGKYFAPQAAAELLREVGRVSPGGGEGSGSSLKRASAFIMEVSERCPPLVLGNLACLLPHLDSDNATLRSALVTTLGSIVARSYNSATAEAAAKAASAAALVSGGDPLAAAQEAAEGSKRRRDALLDALADRIHDVHSYTRAAALRAWCSLTTSTAVPMDRFGPVAALAVGRLMDKGSLVRKMAAQLLRTLLENNPFTSVVDPSALRSSLAAVDAWLKVHAPPAVYAEVTGTPMPTPTAGTAKGGAKAKGRMGMKAIEEEDEGAADEEADAEAALTEELLADSAAAMEAEANGTASASGQAQQQVALSAEVVKHIKARQQLVAAVSFAEAFTSCLPAAVELLSSKTASDVRESIKLLSRARAFRVPGAEGSLARMLVLVWSDEPGVKDEVVETFDALYLRNEALQDEDEEGTGGGAHGGEAAAAAEEVPAPAPKAEPAARPKRSSRAKKSLAEDGDEDEDQDAEDEEEEKPKSKGKKAGVKAKAATEAAAEPKPTKAAAKPKKKKAKASSSTLDPTVVAENLVDLLTGAPAAVRTSLEEVLREAATQELLPPGLSEALWTFVAQGVESHARIRVEVGACLVGTLKTQNPQLATATKATVTAAGHHLARARSAMALLSMIGTSLPASLDSPASLARLAILLGPPPATYQVGAGLLRAAMRSLSAITPEGALPDLSLVENALATADYRLARHACMALQRVRGYSVAQAPRKTMAMAAAAEAAENAASKGGKGAGKGKLAASDDSTSEQSRIAVIQRLLSLVAAMISGAWDDGDVECAHWYTAAQAGIDAIFALAAKPLDICTPMLQSLAAGLLLDPTASPAAYRQGLSHTRMARLFFALGHVALRTLAHTEGLASRVKLLRIRAAERAEHGLSSAPAATSAPVGKGKKGTSAAAAPAPGPKDGIEEQLGVSAAEDEKEAELVVHIAEHELSASNLCGLFAPLLHLVVTGHLLVTQQAEAEGQILGSQAADPLTESALLAIVKLMAVSSTYCEGNLQLLFTVLAKSPCPSLRSTITIALGDLAVRFPNLTEPYTSYMYARLRDSDSGVRKSALMVLTHLILAEQIKVKGNVGEIAVCLNDRDPAISDLTKMFFTELSKRSGSPIYNMLPDTLSCLSKLANPQAHAASAVSALGSSETLQSLDRDTFKDIVKFLLGFVAKDKQSEALAEKLLHRLTSAESSSATSSSSSSSGGGGADGPGGVADPTTKALWRDVAFCLSQLPLSDKTVRKMAEGVRNYALALADDDVWESFAIMLAKAKKMLASGGGGGASGSASAGAGAAEGAGAAPSGAPLSKAELREVVDVWERSLLEARSGSVDDDAALAGAAAVRKRAARVAVLAGIDQAGLAAAALAKASSDAQAAILAEKEAAEAAKKSKGRGKGAAAAPPVPASGATKGSAGPKDDEENEPPVIAKKAAGKAAPASNAAPTSGRGKKKGLVVESDEEEEAVAQAPPAAKARTKR